MRLEFVLTDFERYSNIKFNENPPTGSPTLHVDGLKDGQTDMTKLIVVFRNFAKAPKNGFLCMTLTTYSETQSARLYTGVAITRLLPANLMNLILEILNPYGSEMEIQGSNSSALYRHHESL